MNDTIARAQEFVWANARLLERQLFAYLFAGGAKEPVPAALRGYQNADGGFGNGLEPDKRDPHSQPVDCEHALHILDEIDGFDDPMVARLCDFLPTITTTDGGLPFALPTVNDYPHAPWWTADADPPASLNPTASIVGLLLKHGVRHPWVTQAADYCWGAISELEMDEFHTLMPVITFLEHAKDRVRAEQGLDRIAARLREPGVIATDPDAEGYVQKPLDWAPRADSWARRLFSDDLLAIHLKALAARQQADGGWPISWDPISEGVRLEWRGWVTILALRTLQSYGALGG
jgi:hypothetical protein